ncbi:MAG: hypothetical protein AAFV43_12170 [Planctomycetota bacterium]
MLLARTISALALAAVVGGSTAEAFPGGYGGFYDLGVGGLYRSLDFPTERRVPYFAARPPVYYSRPVPRTYGYSPFAYGPNVRTPDVVAEPMTIVNPFVPSSKKQPQKADGARRSTKKRDMTIAAPAKKPAPQPKMIVNPYVNAVADEPVYH